MACSRHPYCISSLLSSYPHSACHNITLQNTLNTHVNVGVNVHWHSGESICVLICVSRPELDCERKVCKLRHPAMTGGIQLGCGQHIHQRVVVGIDEEVRCMTEVVPKVLTNRPLQHQKLKFSEMKMVILFFLCKRPITCILPFRL